MRFAFQYMRKRSSHHTVWAERAAAAAAAAAAVCADAARATAEPPCRPHAPVRPAGLHSLDLSLNKFTHLPPVLSTATALTCLTLSGNSKLRLRAADAAVILALSRLQRLEINGIVAAGPALLQQLQQRLPHLYNLSSPLEFPATALHDV